MLSYKSINFYISSLSYGNKGILIMKKIFMMGTAFVAMTANVGAMSGYGMPQQSGYGMPQQSGYGMRQQSGYGMPQQSGFGMPQQSNSAGQQAQSTSQSKGTSQQGNSNALTQDVKDSILQYVTNNSNLSADVKGEAAFAVALRVSLNEAVICLTFGQNGEIYRLHTNPRNNGLVTDQTEIQNFNNMLTQAKNGGGSATVSSSIVSNGKQETFVFDVLSIDANHLVVVRHK